MFGMDKCKVVSSPIVLGTKLSRSESGEPVDSTQFKQIVGILMYLTATRPDLMFVVDMLSRFMERPVKAHLLATKRILEYIK